MRFFRQHARLRAPRIHRPFGLPHARPAVESLESRVVPYATTGDAWPHPELVTLSFVPDGTVLGTANGSNITSTLVGDFNTMFNVSTAASWENVIIKAAQTWAAKANINLSVVSDDGSDTGSGNYEQGASNFGDIRIGAYNGVALGISDLADATYPPPDNNYSIAGDINFNTGNTFSIGGFGGYDLYTVALHEFGHAFGLGHSTASNAAMYPVYTNAHTGLASDDVSGIQAVYGARASDAGNTGFSTAKNITSSINTTSLTAVVSNLDIPTTSDADYYTFTAPSNSAKTMTVTVQSTGLSLLTPKVTVYNYAHTSIGSKSFSLGSGAVQDGATLSLSVSITPGSTYFVAVQGVDSSAFSTGAYALTLNLGTGANPTVTLPNTQTLNGNPLVSGGAAPILGQVNDATHDTFDVASAVSAAPPTAANPAPVARVAPASPIFADANMVNGLAGRSASGAIVTPAPTPGVAPPAVLPSPAAPVAAATPDAIPSARAAREDEPPAQRGDPAPAPTPEEDNPPAATPTVSPDGPQGAAGPVIGEGRPAAGSAESAALPPGASAVADATSEDWTPDGALAAASLVFAGGWLRWHAAHRREEEQSERLPAPSAKQN
jgi:hypothetical protein